MSKIKLYTEEQVKEAFLEGYYTDNSAAPYSEEFGIKQTTDSYLRKFMKSLTPIELPSDEEIEKMLGFGGDNDNAINGAKWVIEQLKQQSDGK